MTLNTTPRPFAWWRTSPSSKKRLGALAREICSFMAGFVLGVRDRTLPLVVHATLNSWREAHSFRGLDVGMRLWQYNSLTLLAK